MKNSPKHTDTSGWNGLFRVAIVGAATLKGKEVKDLLTERNFPSTDVRLLDDEESLGQVESIGDEPTFIQSVMPEHLEHVDFTFFCADAAYTNNTWKLASGAGSEVIDLSGAIESNPGVTVRAPWIEQERGVERQHELKSVPVVVADPVAVVLSLLLLRIQKATKIRHANATVFQPASEYGKRGMDELHDQTVNLLSFQTMPTNVFGTQVAFNFVSGLGEEAAPSLAATEQRIVRHFKALAGDAVAVPSLMMIQAPVFHGQTFSLYIELDFAVSIGDLEAAIAGEHVEVMRGDDSPTNVNVAGSADIQVALRADSQNENGFWIWAASDNLRVGAALAVECAEQMVSTRPRGKVQ